MNRILTTFLTAVLVSSSCLGETRTLSLTECRALSIENNKELRMARLHEQGAYYQRKAAFTKYLPKISANGMYMRTGDEISLLSDEQKNTLSHLVDVVNIPDLPLNAVGEKLTDALRTDTRNMTAAAIMLTQPVFMGGKIRAYNRITDYAEQIAGIQTDLQLQNLIVEVDETYWKIVELRSKKELAEGYIKLIETLDNDVSQLIAEGFATKADGLSVKVKLNEAKVTLIQVDNGLSIMKMLMCQLCGLDMDTDLTLTDEMNEDGSDTMPDYADGSDRAPDRPELRILERAVRIDEEKVKIARSEFMPSVVLTGGYMMSNPSVFNSFEKKFKGTWNVGVAVSLPILTWGERSYKLKEAKTNVMISKFNYEEVCEKIELQVSQCRKKVDEARERHTAAVGNREEADENLRCATYGMKEGVIPVSNVIEAQTAWLAAHSDLISASVNQRLANLYLLKSLGQINQSL